jgi:hypothetical protein
MVSKHQNENSTVLLLFPVLSRKIFLLKFLKKIHPKINFNVFSEMLMNHGAFIFGIKRNYL